MQEDEIDLADRPVALLGDEQLGQAAEVFAVALVDFLAEDEGDQVGVLLDAAGFAEIAQLGAMIALASLGSAAQLRENKHRDVQLLGQQLEAARNRADL